MRRLTACVFVTVVAAQEPPFSAESRLVMVPATVTDAKGRAVEGLAARDFVVLDNGRRREIDVDTFTTGVAPIALIVAVQSSGISYAALDKVRKVGSMIQPLVTGERGCAGLVAFDENVVWLQECTSSVDMLSAAFARLRPGEPKAARMLDAAQEAIGRLRKHRSSRRVLLLISESRDRGSETPLEAVAQDAQAAGVAVYSITYSAFKTAFTTKAETPVDPPREAVDRPRTARTEPLSSKGRVPISPAEQRMDILGGIQEIARLGKTKTTEALARSTGGTEFSFARLKGLESAIEKLSAEMHSQYVLSFAPEDAEAGPHRLEVRIPSRPELRVRARPAYWSATRPRL